jgi:hypothetical protein
MYVRSCITYIYRVSKYWSAGLPYLPPNVTHCYLLSIFANRCWAENSWFMAMTSLCLSVLTETNKWFGVYIFYLHVWWVWPYIYYTNVYMIYVKLIPSEWPKETISHVWNSTYALNSFSNWPEVERISGMRFRYQLHLPSLPRKLPLLRNLHLGAHTENSIWLDARWQNRGVWCKGLGW